MNAVSALGGTPAQDGAPATDHGDRLDPFSRDAALLREMVRRTLGLQVSFAIHAFIHDAFDQDVASVITIIDDVVDRWCALSTAERQEYTQRTPAFPPIMHFTWDYATRIEELADGLLRVDLPEDFDAALLVVWREHAKELTRGQDCGPS